MGNFSGRDVASLLDFFQGVVMATDLRRVEIEKKSGYGASDVKRWGEEGIRTETQSSGSGSGWGVGGSVCPLKSVLK